MATTDPATRYLAAKEGGATPQEIYSATKADGVARILAIRVLRSLFGISLDEAKKVLSSVDGPAPGDLQEIGSHEQLIKILEKELGYCACAPGAAVVVLREFLHAAQVRTDSVADREAFSQASRALEACLPLEAAPGFASWFVYGLEQRNLIWHGFRLTDVWITDKGRWLLDAITRFPAPND